jgi:hypothetical protein
MVTSHHKPVWWLDVVSHREFFENHHPKNGGFHSHGDTPIAGWFTMQNPKIMLFRGTLIRTPSNKNSLSPSPSRRFSMGLFKLNINMLLIALETLWTNFNNSVKRKTSSRTKIKDNTQLMNWSVIVR